MQVSRQHVMATEQNERRTKNETLRLVGREWNTEK